MLTFHHLLKEYKQKLKESNIPMETCKLFLLELCNERQYDLYLNIDKEVPQEILDAFRKGIKRILNHEPMNYVLGYAWFYGYQFKVNRDVLIPRYETEELVANILMIMDDMFKDYNEIVACDIGCGSGAIAISVAAEEPKVKMLASDISAEALEVTKQNATLNHVELEYYLGNMLDPLIENGCKVDVLICNPPYIKQDEVLETSVKEFEPHVALFGGSDGLKYYREVFEKAHLILKEKAFLAFEMGWDQKEALSKLVQTTFPDSTFEVLKDINGKDRMLIVKLGG